MVHTQWHIDSSITWILLTMDFANNGKFTATEFTGSYGT